VVTSTARPSDQRCERAAEQSRVANVNPIFTWVRQAQRIPIDDVPAGIVLVAGMTATVEIDARTRGSQKNAGSIDSSR
jgi:multidrug resistance efflux pump